MNLARDGPSTAPLSASALDSVIAWPLLFRLISTAMSFLGPAVPMCTPYTRPYSTWAKSSSPFTSLSRTPAHDASLVGMIVTPYFLSKPSTEAITTLAQSVSGMKPILTSFFSGASEPWACTRARSAGLTPTAPTVATCSTVRRLRLVFNRSVMGRFLGALENKKGVLPWPGCMRKRARRGTPLSMAKPIGGPCLGRGRPSKGGPAARPSSPFPKRGSDSREGGRRAAPQGDVTCLPQQIHHIEHALRHVHQLEALVHGGLAQFLVRGLFAQALALHEQALGPVDGLAVLEFGLGVGQLGAQRLFVLEARHGHVQNGGDALGRQARHDVGRHARRHRVLHV